MSAVRAEPVSFACAFAGSAVYATTTVATAWLLGRSTDQLVRIAGTGTSAGLGAIAGWLLAAAVLQAAGFVCRESLSAVMRFRLQADLRRRLVRRLAALPPAWHRGRSAGDLLSIVDTDVEVTWQAVRQLPSACSALLMLAGGLTAMFLTHPMFGWVGVALFVCSVGFSVAYEQRAGPRIAFQQTVRGDLAAVALESFEAALLVKAMGRQRTEGERFGAAAQRLRRAAMAAGRVRSVFDPVMEALPSLSVLTVVLVGAHGAAAGAVQPGDVVRVAFLVALIALPLVSLGWIISEFPLNATAHARVMTVLGTPAPSAGTEPGPVAAGPARVRLDRVTFHHVDAREPALRDVSLTAEPGGWLALVGPSGSGKSTLCGLLAGLGEPGTGTVRVDGAELHRTAEDFRTRRISLVPQQPFLFRDTIRANVLLGAAAPEDDIWAALRLAQADEFVGALPGGLDTLVGERGHTLSGGQRQRIALARALVRRPGLLVLDDATSAVDARVEAAILEGLDTLRPDLTIVFAASSLPAIQRADEVVYLDRGTVVARGPHHELLRRRTAYAALISAYRRDRDRCAVDVDLPR
ncbi:ABC transporter ATP-binding protein/permease [Dactylosporangium sp. NBC_01737]|uniref:ABC transporter ATP-binding protein n=1 Tax=Dactylosporangium sp. NBC_01737 TaxID=2975959 RepID=UPI002E13C291|nr:ABC transporter ATP-binding protein/permease [Dactylosporangium sp. NBC_01737]